MPQMMKQATLGSCPVKAGSPGWPGELGWKITYGYVLHDQVMGLLAAAVVV